MGLFSKLKKVLNPGGTAVGMLAGNNKDYIGPADFLLDQNKTPKPPAPVPFDPGQRVGASINGQSGVAQPSMNLGWTNGGYNYHNSPFNQQPKAPPMSFGGPTPAGGGASGIGASGAGGMMMPSPLPPQASGGSMPPAGAPAPQGAAPTAPNQQFRIPPNPEMIRAMLLRGGGNKM